MVPRMQVSLAWLLSFYILTYPFLYGPQLVSAPCLVPFLPYPNLTFLYGP